MMVDFPVDPDYAAMVDAVLSRWSTDIEPGQGAEFDAASWTQLEELGLTRLMGGESAGGSGASWSEAVALHRLSGYHGVALPLAEHDLLAGWLCERLALPVDARVTSVAVVRAGESGAKVPYGRNAQRLLVLTQHDDGWALADLDAAQVALSPGENLAREPRDLLAGEAPDQGRRVDAAVVEELRFRGALARAAQLGGALQRCVELATEHASVREQFGRPLVKFQAVQALLAEAAAETALAQAAVLGAVVALGEHDEFDDEVRRAIAVAKSCASHSAGVVCRQVHQVLGAIGFTTEHALHRYSTRLLAWREEFGTRDEWDQWLVDAVMADAIADPWAYVVGR